MIMKDPERHDVLILANLIRNYINYQNSNAGVELSNMKIKGDDLLDALDSLGFETEKETEEYRMLKGEYPEKVKAYENLETKYKKLDENYKSLINTLELLIKDSLPEKIKNLIEKIKKE
jgi:GT2 family glycosyltransferase